MRKKFQYLSRTCPPALFILAIIFLFTGCAIRQPLISPLPPPEKEAARALLNKLIDTPCSDFIDIDLTLNWRGYGQQRTIRLGLQATKDGWLRVSGFDPLSRPFFIFVTDGYYFTMVDNRQGRGYKGSLDSEFIRSYLPQEVSSKTMFLLLSGRPVDNQEPVDIVLVMDDQVSYYRYIFTITDEYALHSEINTESGLLARQFIVGKYGEIIIAVDYNGRLPLNYCHLPLTLGVKGEAITGTVHIVIDKVYDDTVIDKGIFLLRIPGHFIVTEVE